MTEAANNELEIAKQQLALCKQQDQVLEEIEMKLYEMKKIAQYAADHELTNEEATRLNKQIGELQFSIDVLGNELSQQQILGQKVKVRFRYLDHMQFRHNSDYYSRLSEIHSAIAKRTFISL